MTAGDFLSVSELQSELHIGKATVKYLLKRFETFIPHKVDSGRVLYPPEVIITLSSIHEKLRIRVLPSQIEKELELAKHDSEINGTTLNKQNIETGDIETNEVDLTPPQKTQKELEDIRFSPDGLEMIKSLFADIGTQQERIARAHEKRAQAEERKAVAIEKRAIAEEKKAQAMNNIATALQEMNQTRNNINAQQIAREAAAAIVNDEISDDSIENAFLESKVLEHHSDEVDDENDALDDLNGLSDLISDTDETESPLVDLSDLIDNDSLGLDSFDDGEDMEDLQDLSELITDIDPEHDTLIDSNDLTSIDMPPHQDDAVFLDDLSLLIDTPIPRQDMDDLSLLVDTDSFIAPESLDQDAATALDNLSLLINAPVEKQSDQQPMDDLSQLIDQSTEPDPGGELDDLSKLVNMDEEYIQPPPIQMDDLSKLIDHPPASPEPSAEKMDDLSMLIEPVPEPSITDEPKRPSLKPDITPEENLAEYKKIVMNIILQLKNDGCSVEETTKRLNEDGVRTLSGKEHRNTKAIAQVYKFIDAAR